MSLLEPNVLVVGAVPQLADLTLPVTTPALTRLTTLSVIPLRLHMRSISTSTPTTTAVPGSAKPKLVAFR
jgi:hypothetical protein